MAAKKVTERREQIEQMPPPSNQGNPNHGLKVSRVGREPPLPFPEADAAVHLVNLPRNRNLPQKRAPIGKGMDWLPLRGKWRIRYKTIEANIADDDKAKEFNRLIREGRSKEEALGAVGITVR